MTPKDPAKACDMLSSMVDDFSDDLSILETYSKFDTLPVDRNQGMPEADVQRTGGGKH